MSAATAQQAGDATQQRPGSLRVWFQAVRFFSFTASIVPIVVGSALALFDRTFDALLFVVMLSASVACHAGANLANDYFDDRKGIDTDDSLGPSKVIQLGYLTSAQVLRGTVVALGIATVLGLYVVYRTGWAILIVALLSLAAAVLYTGGPKPLGYVALGEATVFVFMGLVMVGGAYYVHSGHFTGQSVLLPLPIASLVAAILHCNNIRDIDFDHDAGKRTLANVLGRKWANREYLGLVYGAYLAIVALVLYDRALWPALAAVVTLPIAIDLVRTVSADSGPSELNVALRRTAGLHLRVGLFLTAGLIVASAIDRYL
ncbi:MAG: 1,4-dihydroxy-2-naphthoate octaprenyltransferase [Thermomicrobiales bacterium]